MPTTLNRTDAQNHALEYNSYLNHNIIVCNSQGCATVIVYYPEEDFHGDVTKVVSYSDATKEQESQDPEAVRTTAEYDITGNMISAGLNCCNLREWEYTNANNYAYPLSVTSGDTGQLTTSATYDLNTGLVKTSIDENNQPTAITYDPPNLRQTRLDSPNGAWSTVEYNDTVFPYHVKSTSSLDATRSISSWSFVNGAGQGFRSRSQTANGYLSSDVEFDNMGRPTKSYNPYTVSGLMGERPTGIKFSEVLQRDALERVLQTKLPDDTTVQSSYSGLVATMTDQAGKSRRQLADTLGRIVRVDEPDLTGNLGAVTAPVQPTNYEYDGNDNLKKVTQSIIGGAIQERVFEYDALSRLRRERQVEASPTLDVNGIKGSPDPNKWTGYYKYDNESLLEYGVDARGVRTTFAYDGLNRVETVTYTGETGYQTPQVTYTYSEAESGFFNVGRLTKVRTAANATYGTPETIQNYDYDTVGQVKKHSQSIGNQVYNLEYGYNLAGQLVSEKYPSGKIVNMTVDNFGVTQTIADSQRTYLNGVTFDNRGVLSQINFGNGTSETFSHNDRFQMTSQSLNKGAEILQKYDYSYGQVDVTNGNVDLTKNNGQLGKIESFIGTNKQASQRFGYDELGRLSESREHRGDNDSLTYKQKFDFDRFGNLYRKASNNPTAGQANPLPYTPIEETDISKSTNRFTTGTTYDDAGQVITDNKFRGGMNFVYDANGRNVKVSRTGALDAWTVYDALGNRVATKINDIWQYVIYDAFGKLVAEYGLPSEGSGGVKYIQQDWQGSIRAVTNNGGFVVSRTDHQAFGEDVGFGTGLRSIEQGYSTDKVSRQGYGLTENDQSSGQQHTWFRKLETKTGRWSSPDPYKGSMSLGDPQSFNRYSYVGNQPTNYVDPSGLVMGTCSAEYGFMDCGGGGGFWGGAGGFGGHVAAYNRNFGWLPPGVQRELHQQIREFVRWLGNSPYIGDYTWDHRGSGWSFRPGHGWDGLFDRSTGRFNIPNITRRSSPSIGNTGRNGGGGGGVSTREPPPEAPASCTSEGTNATLDFNVSASVGAGVQAGFQVNSTHLTFYIGFTGGASPLFSGAVTGSKSRPADGINYNASGAFVAAGGYSGQIKARSFDEFTNSFRNGTVNFGAGTPNASVGLTQAFKFRHSCY